LQPCTEQDAKAPSTHSDLPNGPHCEGERWYAFLQLQAGKGSSAEETKLWLVVRPDLKSTRPAAWTGCDAHHGFLVFYEKVISVLESGTEIRHGENDA
jgi:hypothetical protein